MPLNTYNKTIPIVGSDVPIKPTVAVAIELSAEHICNEDSKTIDANIIIAPANDLHFTYNGSFVKLDLLSSTLK